MYETNRRYFAFELKPNLDPPLHKKWSFPSRISSVNVTKSAGNCAFDHIYWRNPWPKTSFFAQCALSSLLYPKEIFSYNWKISLAAWQNKMTSFPTPTDIVSSSDGILLYLPEENRDFNIDIYLFNIRTEKSKLDVRNYSAEQVLIKI